MAYVIKIKYENILRRITLDNNEDLSFAQLDTRIRELFQFSTADEVLVTYTDKDGDTVTMGSDQELNDALMQQSLNPLRMNVSLVASKTSPALKPAILEKVTDTERVDGQLTYRLKKVSSTADSEIQSLKQLIQSYEPLFEGVTSPTQIRGLVENLVQSVTSSSHRICVASGPDNTAPKPSGRPSGVQIQSRRDRYPGARHVTHIQTRRDRYPGADPVEAEFQFGQFGSAPKIPIEKEGTEDVVHQGVTCDVCGVSPIVGLRWKSQKKYDYDMCNTCFEKNGNVNEYTKIDLPMQRTQFFHPPNMMRMNPAGPGFGPGFRGGRFGVRGDFRGNCAPAPIVFGGKLDARFVCDVTMADGTEVPSGAKFTKVWRLRNSGIVPWPQQTKLLHVGGDELGQVSMPILDIPEGGLAPEEEIEASVDLIAPEKPGRYASHWRLASPYGPKFGHRVWVLIQVVPQESIDHSADAVAPAQEVKSVDRDNVSTAPAQEKKFVDDVLTSLAKYLQLSNVDDVENAGSVVPAQEVKSVNVDNVSISPAQDMKSVDDALTSVAKYLQWSDVENANSSESTTRENVQLEPTMSFVKVEMGTAEDSMGSTETLVEGKAVDMDDVQATFERNLIGEGFSMVDMPSDATSLDKTVAEAEGGNTMLEGTQLSSPAVEVGEEYLFKFGQEEVDATLLAEDQSTKLKTPLPVPTVEVVDDYLFKFGEEELNGADLATDNTLLSVVAVEGRDQEKDASLKESVQEQVNQADKLEVASSTVEADLSSPKFLLAKLKAMGFTDEKLNLELLEKNKLDLRKTLDDLCAAEEWDPILEELEEMGFYDTDMNRRLMHKNNGSVKRVVKDLVQMQRAVLGKGKQVLQ